MLLQENALRTQWAEARESLNKFVISTGEVMGLRPTQGDEKRLLSEATLPWKRRPHLCHLDRSEAQWRDLCVDAPSWRCFSTERSVVERSAVSFQSSSRLFRSRLANMCGASKNKPSFAIGSFADRVNRGVPHAGT
jgi:hypothetical protein